jgi:hypothetical protein
VTDWARLSRCTECRSRRDRVISTRCRCEDSRGVFEQAVIGRVGSRKYLRRPRPIFSGCTQELGPVSVAHPLRFSGPSLMSELRVRTSAAPSRPGFAH